jgi:hypothetical protein
VQSSWAQKCQKPPIVCDNVRQCFKLAKWFRNGSGRSGKGLAMVFAWLVTSFVDVPSKRYNKLLIHSHVDMQSLSRHAHCLLQGNRNCQGLNLHSYCYFCLRVLAGSPCSRSLEFDACAPAPRWRNLGLDLNLFHLLIPLTSRMSTGKYINAFLDRIYTTER